jgi:RNA polymerase sigma factor (sigma-70 family)
MDFVLRTLESHWKAYNKDLLRRLLYSGLSKEAAEDIVQETFIKLYEALERGAEPKAVWPWLCTVSSHRAVDQARSHFNTRSDDIDDQITRESLTDKSLEERSSILIQDCVDQGIERFAQHYPDRALYIRASVDGVSLVQLSERSGRTIEAVKQYLYQSRKKLSEYLDNCRQYLNNDEHE